MSQITMKQLLEAGVHFGHQTRRWNPKMKPYIFGARNGIYIIDLQKTVRYFKHRLQLPARDLRRTATRSCSSAPRSRLRRRSSKRPPAPGSTIVNNRWLGGMLTNFATIKRSIDRLKKIDVMAQDGTYDLLTKKEVLQLEREKDKLEKSLGGIKEMNRLPGAIFVIDPKKENIAVKEARKLGIPVVAMVDTNCDPGRDRLHHSRQRRRHPCHPPVRPEDGGRLCRRCRGPRSRICAADVAAVEVRGAGRPPASRRRRGRG